MDELIENFITALSEEIEFIKNRGGGGKFTATNGVFVDEKAGKFLYEFVINNPAGLPDDVPVEVACGDKRTQGFIVAIEGLKILIALNETLGPEVPQITISVDPYYLMEILKERLGEVKTGKISFNRDLAQKVFGMKECTIGQSRDFEIRSDYAVDKWQSDAIALALGSELSYIWGPPGTGKTRTLSALAEIMLKKNQSILILSHTNIAVDNAMEKIAALLQKDKNLDFTKGKVLRYGNCQLKTLFKDFPELDIETWIEIRSADLHRKRQELSVRFSKAEDDLNIRKKTVEVHRRIFDISAKISQNKHETAECMKKKETTIQLLENLRSQLGSISQKLAEANDAGRLKRLFKGLNLEKLSHIREECQRSIAAEMENKRYVENRLQEIANDKHTLTTQLGSLNGELNEYSRRQAFDLKCQNGSCGRVLRVNPQGLETGLVTCPHCGTKFRYAFSKQNIKSQEALEKEIHALEQTAKSIKQEISSIDSKLGQIETEILKEVRVLATTLTKLYTDKNIYSRSFDVVIVDEASMAPLPMLFIAAGVAAQKLVVIGDFRQLAPIANADTDAVEQWLKRDIFEHNGIISSIEQNARIKNLVQLREQHRMHESIVQLINDLMYDGELRTAKKQESEKKEEERTIGSNPFPEESVVLCDTSKFNPWCSFSARHSPFNIYNAFLAGHLAEEACMGGVESIGIITPFRAQTRLLYRIVGDKELTNIDPSSVHRFQGREKELVIFDLVEGPGHPVRWLSSTERTSDTGRLINVAVTRARSKIIVIGNIDYLSKKLSENSILWKVVKRILDCPNGRVVDTNSFFRFAHDEMDIEKLMNQERMLAEDIVVDNKSYIYTQAYFYPFFYKDLLQSQKQVIIISPYMTRRRIDHMISLFRQLLDKKIQISVVTRPIGKQQKLFEEQKELADYLREIGVDVVFKRRLHEKLALIDKNIIWHGSLNILSHRNTTEVMFRNKTERPDFGSEFLKLLGINIDKFKEDQAINERIKELNKRGLGVCPRYGCGGKFIVKRGRYGVFLPCSNYPPCKERMKVDLEIIAKVYGPKYVLCEHCGKPMQIKYNPRRKSRFLGCSSYPDCKFTRPL